MPRRYFFLWLPIVIALGAIAVTRISFNVDPLDVLPDDARGVKGLRIFADQFSGKGELIITLDGGMVEVSSEAQSLADCLSVCAKPGCLIFQLRLGAQMQTQMKNTHQLLLE